MTDKPIPQADPRAGFLALRSRIDWAIARVIEGGTYILGREVAGFEQEFSAFVGARHGIGVASGTDALTVTLKALGVGPEDYVVTVSHTAGATVAAIELAGARPLLVDIDPTTFTLDAGALADVLARPPGPIAAIIPVHLYGQPADLGAIEPLAAAAGVPLIEDAAQCHGALWGTRMTGSIGRAGAFSFYPTKNLGALGDGGIVVTNDDDLANRIHLIRQYGWRERHVSDVRGMNSRLDEVQAAILRVRLTMLDAENQSRREIAAAYDSGLAGLPLQRPVRQPGATHVFHQYVVRTPKRDLLRHALGARGIGTAIHYPVPVHLQPAYRGRVAHAPSGFAETERAAGEVLSLPIFPQLTEAQVARVIAGIRDAIGEIG